MEKQNSVFVLRLRVVCENILEQKDWISEKISNFSGIEVFSYYLDQLFV